MWLLGPECAWPKSWLGRLVSGGAKHDAHVGHRELLQAVGLPAPLDLLRLERLRLLAQFVSKSCGRVREMLEACLGTQRCWLTEVWSDFFFGWHVCFRCRFRGTMTM